MELSLLAAFLGGALALLSPCGALLLPAFFATTVGTRRRLLLHGGLFLLGLSATLVPLGLGASLLGSLLTAHRDLLITVAGWLIITFGVLQVLGLGFDLSRLLPGTRSVRSAAHGKGSVLRSVLLGTVSGIAGFCSGPILGAVLTMAATEPSPVLAGVLLAVYGAGMVVPLVAIAAVWSRLGARGRARLRGRAWQVGPFQLHTTSVLTGVLLVVVGVVFLRTNGLASLPQLVPTQVLGDVQSSLLTVGAAVPEPVLIAVLALAALGVWAVWRRREAEGGAARQPEPSEPSEHTGGHA
ncbi:PEP-CTERM protein-sorting domain-containing protein [Georgenia satyanarayanai]|uniref:PEP-CTERM protein-sorting domain-containing protein n=1 Tax=Georgenia satyanarayanai TaxID=860221 RepID=A0A2Y8ZVL2_9MICO|nr:cytochrome c biogenesis CcdA family protein [Georgenia satyanarayanai]PYG01610.1 putative secreted protein with PEP-CTERM sorting signal [Georgenia satyanarayanai]SSA36410.1 PEP-CTERM protein-sorting domain-containing protein [Georgenia satyanarayanai]